MSTALRALTGASLIALVSASAFAEDAVTAPPIVITATRYDTPLTQIASSMTVIDSTQIEQENKQNVVDVLREVPGVTIGNNGGQGQVSRVFMRGTNSNHVLVLIDGVPVNDPSDPGDAFDFANLTTDNIERIEVLRGPQSTLYGSEALGGVINIITRQGIGKPTTNAFAEYGRYNSRKEGIGNSGEIGNTSYSVTLSNTHSDGISALDKKFGGFEKDGNDMYTLSTNVASKLTDNFTAKVNARYNSNFTEFDSPGAFTRPADDPLAHNLSRQFNGRIAGELALDDGKWVQELSVSTLNVNRDQITEYFDSLGNAFFGRQQQLGWRQTVDWLHHLKWIPDNVLTLGVEAYSDHFKTNQSNEFNVDNRAFFADNQYAYGKQFFVNTGARIDDHQAFGRQFTWKVAPGYRFLSTGTTLKATYGTGFKAPSLSQLYDPNYGNPLLHPEQSKGWDAGFEQSLLHDKIVFGSTAFRNDIRNLIGFNPAPPFAAINTGKARTEGVESTLTLRPATPWLITASHTYTLSEDRSRDVELLRRPKHQATLGATYQYSLQGDVGINARYSSQRRDIDINFPYGPVFVKPFTTLDISTNYKLTPIVTLYGRIENLLDKRYEEVYAYGEPGMSLFAGIKASY